MKKNNNKYTIIVITILVICFLTLNRGFRNLIQRYMLINTLKKENYYYVNKQSCLSKEIELFQKNTYYTEYVFKKLGYLKPGEVEYRFINLKNKKNIQK